MWIGPILGVLYQTTDGGMDWTLCYTWTSYQGIPWDYPSFEGVDFSMGTLNGWACGEGIDDTGAVVDELIIHTTNGANWNWQYRELAPQATALKDISAVNSSHVWAVGRQGLILRSSDSGGHWSPDTRGVAEDLLGVDFVDTLNGWACGANGTILRYGPGLGVEERTGVKGEWSEAGFKATPNPFASFAKVPEHERERFALFDLSGRKVGIYWGDRIGEGLSPGVYFLKPEGRNAKPLRIVKIR
jgi:hypothetical protein